MNDKNFAQIVFGLPVPGPFTYVIPHHLTDRIAVGMRVWAPFRNSLKVGYVVGFSNKTEVENIKSVQDAIDEEPILSQTILDLTKWIAERYFCSWGEAIEAALPGSLKRGKTDVKKRIDILEEDVEIPLNFRLTSRQNEALKLIRDSLDKEKFKVFLLHGITGSGKTEVYMRAIDITLNKGKSCIVLVPEISLTPQTAERFRARFGERVAVLHSRLLDSHRFHEWKRVLDGKASIIIGARSAILSPAKNLGLIVVDEEHESTYKQEDVPRYNARDVAITRGRLSNAAVIFGSATPSLESYHQALNGEYRLIRLPERVENRRLPDVRIVDMREEKAGKRSPSVFSRALENSIREALDKKEQAMLFLNRRGFATFVHCRKCGLVLKCKYCSVTLNFHSDLNRLVCHYCNYQTDPPEVCPKCNSSYIRHFGIGTQKVESEVYRLFPDAKIARMDTDATTKRGSHKNILGDFKKREIDILIGTQMIAKGLDFPNVTLVGIISADITLNLPDFRAAERSFNLITQVAGRSGRGKKKGRVIIQTYTPEHYAIQSCLQHDYKNFYEQEINFRKELFYPPFSTLANLTLRGRKEERVKEAAEDLARIFKKKSPRKEIELVGPAPAIIPKLKGRFRYSLLLKAREPEELSGLLKKSLKLFKKPSGLILTVDVDPR